MELNKLFNENCLSNEHNKGMNRVPDKSIDLIIRDLPYGVTNRNKWDEILPLEELWKQYKRVIKDNGAIVLTAVKPFSSLLIASNPKMYRYDIIWEKNKSTGFLNAKKMPLRSHEEILVFYKKLPTYNPQKTTGHKPANTYTKHTSDGTNYGETKSGISGGGQTDRYPTSVWRIPVMNNDDPRKFHPTQKPVELYEKIIKTYSNEGDTVLDNCSGAGTAAIACINTNRNYICFEWNKDNPDQYYGRSLEWIKEHEQQVFQTV
ncbi:DNA-methyltransferase [Bacillus subtilis]|uniref:Adenine-specific methyltransferase n=1 Tax=Bacillus subtilis TaxID=1423 RepID=A0AAP1EGS1_BACIU|nr:site-specific DNA-methyltransferase [Bacillus subtilis]KIN53263.1 Adenine-specific methyltransferase [Bacillus subtilis]KZD95387.1 Adenine-specific methyltransferase [Bacillus subtilis]